jgi:hypothetical protein
MRLGFLCHIIGLAVSLVATPTAVGTVLYVDAARHTGANNGASWDDAFQGPLGLQAALAVAVSGTEIWIADGRYTPAPPNGDRSASFVLPGGVALYGGFAGHETALEQRNVALHAAILSGDLNGNDAPPSGLTENSRHVLRATGLNSTAVADGLTVRDGQADGPTQADESGANVLVLGGSPIFRNCLIAAGWASWAGGGMLLDNAAVDVSDCRFVGNTAQFMGGGVAHQAGGASHFTRCRFEANRGGYGCGLYNGPSNLLSSTPGGAPVVIDCDFVENLGEIGAASGVGIFDLGGAPRIERCRFIRNTTQAGGGGLYLARSTAEVRDCDFVENEAPGDGGGGVYVDAEWSGGPPAATGPRFVNGLFAGNNGAILVRSDSTATLINCSLVHNSIGIPFLAWPTAFCGGGGSLFLHNCIVWGNQPVSSPGLAGVLMGSGLIQAERCAVQLWDGSRPGTDTFAVDPVFVDSNGPDNDPQTYADNDYRLGLCSPALDIGDADALPVDVTADRAGQPRFHDVPGQPDIGIGAVAWLDLGAYESAALTANCASDCVGDPSGDRRVDFEDLPLLIDCLGGPTQSAGSGCALSNLNTDGVIDLRDFAVFQQRFGQLCP